MLQNIENSCFS